MDYTVFPTDKNEYIIEITKEPRVFGYSKFGNYICKIKFCDFLHRVLLELVCNEKRLTELMNLLYDDNNLYSGGFYCIRFENNLSLVLSSSEVSLYPSEDDPSIYLQCFEDDPIYGKISRLFVKCSIEFKDNFIFNIHEILKDIPYLEQMIYYDLYDYIVDDLL